MIERSNIRSLQSSLLHLSPSTEPLYIDEYQRQWFQFRGDLHSFYIQVLSFSFIISFIIALLLH